MGRPTRYRREHCELVERRMTEGASAVAVCRELGISKSTFFHNWLKKHPEFAEAYDRGKTFCEAHWETVFIGHMNEGTGNSALIKLFMANRFGWSDKTAVDNTSSDGSLSLHVPSVIQIVGVDANGEEVE